MEYNNMEYNKFDSSNSNNNNDRNSIEHSVERSDGNADGENSLNISDTLKQGIKFQNYIKKITGLNGTNVEPFISQADAAVQLQELASLKQQYTDLVTNYSTSTSSYRTGYETYLKNAPNALYMNKHVQLGVNGPNGYVTRNGVFKPYDGDGSLFNNVNGCPSTANRVVIPGKNPTEILKSNNLRMGALMQNDQSCGDEGSNVLVMQAGVPEITYSGCYQSGDTTLTNLQLQPGGAIFNVNTCKFRAVDTGAAAFALKNYNNTTKLADCYTSATVVSPTLLGNVYSSTDLWTSADTLAATNVEFQTPYKMILKDNGFINIVDSSADLKLVKQIANTGDPACNILPIITSFKETPDPTNIKPELFNSSAPSLNVNNAPSFSFKISSIYSAAPATLNYKLKYKCNDVLQPVMNITNGTPNTIITINACPNTASCPNSYLILKNEGIMEINKGVGPPTGTATQPSPLYRKTYSVTNSVANPSYLFGNGKTGTNYISSGQVLSADEYIASPDGKLVLIMKNNELYLKTFTQQYKCANNAVDGKTYGTTDTYALYNFNSPMDNSNIGKLAYIDDDGLRHVYPDSMIQRDENNYKRFMNYDSLGNNMANMPIQNSNSNACKLASNALSTSGGFVYDNNTKKCWIKNNNLTLATPKTYANNTFLYVKKPVPIVPNSCSNTIREIDSNRWKQYKSSSIDMHTSFSCNAARLYSSDQNNIRALEDQIYDMAIVIIGKMINLQRQGISLSADMRAFKRQLEQSIHEHDNENSDLNGSIKSALDGMMNDADLMVLQENTRYMFLSIFAVGALVVALNAIKK